MAQEDPIKDLKDNLQEMCFQLQEDLVPHGVIEGFILEEFLRDFAAAVKEVHSNGRRIGFAFAEPPLPSPKETAFLMTCMKKACREVLVVFARLPRCQGRTLRKEMVDYLHELYDAVKDVVSSIGPESGSCLQAAVKLCKKCEDITDISKDNKEAVCSVLGTLYELIEDQFNVLYQLIEEDEALALDMQRMPVRNGFNQPIVFTWTGQERPLLSPGMELMKALSITVRNVRVLVKSRGRCMNRQENADLDRIADLFRTSSSFMDDFIACLYPPIFAAAVQESGTALKGHVLAMLKATKESHFYNSAQEPWVAFLERAAEDNYQTLLSRIALL